MLSEHLKQGLPDGWSMHVAEERSAAYFWNEARGLLAPKEPREFRVKVGGHQFGCGSKIGAPNGTQWKQGTSAVSCWLNLDPYPFAPRALKFELSPIFSFGFPMAFECLGLECWKTHQAKQRGGASKDL